MATAKYFTIGCNHKILVDSHLSVHAEHDCIIKMERKNKFTKDVASKEKIDLICIRYSKTGKLGYSRPCMGCIKRMCKCSFNIRNVYYSTGDGTIIREKLEIMDKSEKTILSSGHRIRAGITRDMHDEYMKNPVIIPQKHKKFYNFKE